MLGTLRQRRRVTTGNLSLTRTRHTSATHRTGVPTDSDGVTEPTELAASPAGWFRGFVYATDAECCTSAESQSGRCANPRSPNVQHYQIPFFHILHFHCWTSTAKTSLFGSSDWHLKYSSNLFRKCCFNNY